MGSFSNNFQEHIAKYSPLRSRKSKQQEQQLATEQEQQDALDAFQEAFNTNLLADGQAILEKAVLEIVATGKIALDKWSESSELRDFEAKYGLLAKSKLLVHIRSLNDNPPNLPPFQLDGTNKAAFVRIIDKQGRKYTVDLTALAQAKPQVKELLDGLYIYNNELLDPPVLEAIHANIQQNEDIQQFIQVQYTRFYARFLAAQMMRAWISDNASQILLNRLLTPKTEQHRQQILPDDPETQETILEAHIQREHKLQRAQTEFEFSDDDIDKALPSTTAKSTPLLQNAQSTSAPEPQKQKENTGDSLKQILRDIFTSAANFLFGVEVANIVLKQVGLHDSKTTSEHQSQTVTATGKKDPQPYKLSTSLVTMFKKVKDAIALPTVSANFGGKLVEPITTPSPKN